MHYYTDSKCNKILILQVHFYQIYSLVCFKLNEFLITDIFQTCNLVTALNIMFI